MPDTRRSPLRWVGAILLASPLLLAPTCVPEDVPRLSRAAHPAASVLPPGLESCALIGETRCDEGAEQRCAIYDSGAAEFPGAPPVPLEQAYTYDRYFDLYQKMEGQHTDRVFTRAMAPGTPEPEWSDPALFERHEGFGDGSGWTGTALLGAAARYAVTGTSADYERMLELLDTMVFLYDANDIPGVLMRSHFAMLEEGAPRPIGNPGKALADHREPDEWHFRYPLSEEHLAKLPAYYTEGVEILGTHYDVTPLWMGDASRDMYVRSLPGVMLAYDLLGDGAREEGYREVLRREMPCTLNRLKKMRIRNLQQNPLVAELVALFLGSGQLDLEPDDIDFTEIDTLIGYVMEQPNPASMDAFDARCPAGPPMRVDPAYDLDAAGGLSFWVKMASIVNRSQRQGELPIAWIQVPSIRGSDSLFMLQWALTAHYLTGQSSYLRFVEQLMAETDFWPIVDTMGSFYLPKWCASHFGPSLLYPSLWNLQRRIDKEQFSKFWVQLAGFIAEEVRYKEIEHANDAFFGVLYRDMVDERIDPDVNRYVADMVELFAGKGQSAAGDDPFEPIRNYPVDWLASPLPGIPVEPLSEEDRGVCLDGVTIGDIVVVPGSIEDENPRAVEGLPVEHRVHGSFVWTIDPYMLKRTYGSNAGHVQWPMVDRSVAYWSARLNGAIGEGTGSALAWRDTGGSCR